jgi:hydrogenase maturation protein HypF
MNNLHGQHIHITGIVQGVGFRPFVYGLAQRLHLTGCVRNTSAGVDIEANGSPAALAAFDQALQTECPPLARIDSIEIDERPFHNDTQFEIIHSRPIPHAFQPISPDVSVCFDCLRELFDPTDRRYGYPFINCTNCGPRFTIIKDIPYDRPKTTMAAFAMCPRCAAEYHDPTNRRFHAEPIACPDCGPRVWLEFANKATRSLIENKTGETTGQDTAVQHTRHLLRQGKIVAIKGLGGFHLACDATNRQAVAELRRRKLRRDKPFAVMMPNIETVYRYCEVNDAERKMLLSRQRPIVVLRRRATNKTIAPEVAPNQHHLGVMLPYTPLHYLLLKPEAGFTNALVMTSGNLSEEPIAYTNAEARERLTLLADAILLHDRDIHLRCDDSVARIIQSPTSNLCYPLPTRRARGYAPFPVKLPQAGRPLLAVGAELKNTFCFTRDNYGFLSHYIGDMENYDTLCAFESAIHHYESLFRIRPQALAYDRHPDYLATRYALKRAEADGLPAIGIQHHHAHIAACMAEHGLTGAQPVIGVAFDGTGYGDDGRIWGGEFLLADYDGYRRAAHLAYVPLPGGDMAVRGPWRLALAWLQQADIDWEEDLPPVKHTRHELQPVSALDIIHHQIKAGLNAPLTSSMGRLFDAVASLIGIRQTVNYEAQAAIELEAMVDGQETAVYPVDIRDGVIDPAPLIRPCGASPPVFITAWRRWCYRCAKNFDRRPG